MPLNRFVKPQISSTALFSNGLLIGVVDTIGGRKVPGQIAPDPPDPQRAIAYRMPLEAFL
jgi:hypothetical protein